MIGLRMHSALNSELNASAIALSYESPLASIHRFVWKRVVRERRNALSE